MATGRAHMEIISMQAVFESRASTLKTTSGSHDWVIERVIMSSREIRPAEGALSSRWGGRLCSEMSVGQSTAEIHQAAGKTRSRAARGQVWSLVKMIAECRDHETRADARGGDKDGALENTSFYLGWRMKREGCWHRAIVRFERHRDR